MSLEPRRRQILVVVELAPVPESIEVDTERDDLVWERVALAPVRSALAALEVGLRLGGEVTAISPGPEEHETILRRCLAQGAAAAVRVWDPSLHAAGPAAVARALAAAIRQLPFDLILCGSRGFDQNHNWLAPMLAEFVGVAFVGSGVELHWREDQMVVTARTVAGGLEEYEATVPALIMVEPNARLSGPLPAPSLTDVIRAQQTPITLIEALPAPPRAARVEGFRVPRPRPGRLPAPEPGLSVEARVRSIVSPRADRLREVVTGPPEQVADRIYHVLLEHGFLNGRTQTPAGAAGIEPSIDSILP